MIHSPSSSGKHIKSVAGIWRGFLLDTVQLDLRVLTLVSVSHPEQVLESILNKYKRKNKC